MKKQIPLIAICIVFLSLFTACENALLSRDKILAANDLHYKKEQEAAAAEEEGDGQTEEGPAPEFVNVSSAFKYILPSGEIDSSCPSELSATLTGLFSNSGKQSVNFFNENTYRISVVETGNLTESYFANEDLYTLSDASKGEYIYKQGGETFTIYAAVTTKAKDVTYYQYRSINPFFSAYGAYNTRSFEKADGTKESLMQRFQFFRWSGTVSGQGVSNYMVALDTYTGLIFQFSEIDDWATIMGIDAPSKYAAFESYDERRNFYEYDPAGYVDASGTIVTTDWYKTDVAKPFKDAKTEPPPLTGKSPYYYEEGVTDSIPASIPPQGGHPVSGTISVKAKTLKNLDVDTLITFIPNDTFLVGGSTLVLSDPKYSYSIATKAYSGSSGEQTDAYMFATESKKEITKNNSVEFANNTKTITFANTEEMLTLELLADISRDAQGVEDITKLGGFEIGWITSLFGNDVILPTSSVSSLDVPTALVYNREKLYWEDGNGFTLGDGETKDYIINYTYGDGTVALTYELSWSRGESVSSAGNNVLIPEIKKVDTTDNNVSISANGNSFTIEYVDTTEVSAFEEKEVEVNLYFNNLESEVSIVSHLTNTSVVKCLTLADYSAAKLSSSSTPNFIPIKFTIGSDVWQEQSQRVTLTVLYPSTGYDPKYSPNKIELIIKRRYEESTGGSNE